MEPQLINKFAIAAFCAFKDFGTDSEGDCNLELIRFFFNCGLQLSASQHSIVQLLI